MDILIREAIENGLKEKGRVYLCGNLAFPNGLEHIPTQGYEIGISCYREFSADKAHLHSYNTEYNYVLEGELKILLLQEGTEHHLKKGDLFVIRTDEPYIGKALPSTKVLFSKVPGGNDKVEVPMSVAVKNWCRKWDAVYTNQEDSE